MGSSTGACTHVNRLIPALLCPRRRRSSPPPRLGDRPGLDLRWRRTFIVAEARHWAPFTTFGYADSGATWLVPGLGVGRGPAGCCCTPAAKASAQARGLGLVHQAVPADQLDAAGEELLARRPPAPRWRSASQAGHAPGLTTDIDRHLADEAWAMEMSSRSEDFKEYGQAAREKRDPDFEGR